MSSKVKYEIFNYSTTTFKTRVGSSDHVVDHGAELTGQIVDPIKSGGEPFSKEIVVTTGHHGGKLDLEFLDNGDTSFEVLASVFCNDLKNPEKDGVLTPNSNAGYIVSASGERDIGDQVRRVTINIKKG